MARILVASGVLMILAVTMLPVSNATQCNTASGCEFWDSNYHEYILYNVDTPNVDVLIVPPASPFATRDIVTIEKSVDAWKAGIAASGGALATGLKINRYTLGKDVPPQAALTDPEIIIVSAEYNPVLLFGIGLQLPVGICTQRGGVAHTFPTHEHDGAKLYRAECKQGGMTCVVVNTNFLLGGARRMFDLNSHEFGHCLGIGHVGDALDFDAKTFPAKDIMSYQYNANQVHCVSNLNTNALKAVYATLLGQTGQVNAGGYIQMTTSTYTQVTCANP